MSSLRIHRFSGIFVIFFSLHSKESHFPYRLSLRKRLFPLFLYISVKFSIPLKFFTCPFLDSKGNWKSLFIFTKYFIIWPHFLTYLLGLQLNNWKKHWIEEKNLKNIPFIWFTKVFIDAFVDSRQVIKGKTTTILAHTSVSHCRYFKFLYTKTNVNQTY